MRRVLSLFSGCGGMDLGFEGGFRCLRASADPEAHPEWLAEDEESSGGDSWIRLRSLGFQTVFANDILPEAKAAWSSWFAGREQMYHLRSLVDLVKEARAEHFSFPGDVDVLTGGFPCQDFSYAGRRRGFDSHVGHDGKASQDAALVRESRGQLYLWMRDTVLLVRPRMFVAENVKGLTTLGNARAIIERDFAAGGYLVVPARVLYAPDFGVPQSRSRVIFYGFRQDALRPEALAALESGIIPAEYDPYPVPTHGPGRKPYVSCLEAFQDLREPEVSEDPSQRKYSRAQFLPNGSQGQCEVPLHGVSPTIRSEHHGNIEFRRLAPEHGGSGEEDLPERRLTVRECARLQTFPDEYAFLPTISASAAYKVIGNAVPCLLAWRIAQRLDELWGRLFR